MRFLGTPGWGPLVVVVWGPSPLLDEGPLGWSSPPLLAGVSRPRRWWWPVSVGSHGVFPVFCVFVARRVCVVPVPVCVLCVCGFCVGGGPDVSSACFGVRVCVCMWRVGGLWLLVLAFLGWGLLLVFV